MWGILIPTYINLKGGEGMEQLYTIREFCKAFRIARDTYYISERYVRKRRVNHMNVNKFTSNQVITRGRLGGIAPSIFASEHKAGLSAKYIFVPTIEIVDEMEKQGWLPVKAQEMRTRNANNQGYQKHMVRFRNFDEGMGNTLTVGDTLFEIILTNSHNGTSAFIFNMGMYRLVCDNGMVVSESAFDAVHVRHSGYDAQNVIDVTGEVVKKAPEIAGKIADFKGVVLTDPERRAFGAAAKRLRFDHPEIIETEKILMPHRQEDSGNTLWQVANVVQENLVKGHVNYVDRDPETGRPRRKSTREIKGIDSNIKLNQSIWSLAEAMKNIKQETGYASL